MAAPGKTRWTPVKRWTAETKHAFEAHLATLRRSRSGHADLDDFIGEERVQGVVLQQAQVLVEAGSQEALRGALELLAPLVAPDTRGTTFRDALLTEANALAALGEVEAAVERCLRLVSRTPGRGEDFLAAGAALARHALRLSKEWQAKAIAVLDLERNLALELSRHDFLYFVEVSRLAEAAGDERWRSLRARASRVFELLPRRDRAGLERRHPQLVALITPPG